MKFCYKQQIVQMVRTLYFCMEAHWAELGKQYDISPAQQHILFILITNGKTLTPSEISELGCWHISTITRLLKPLKERGFVTIEKDPNRSKFKNVTLTPTGENLFHKIIETIAEDDSFPFMMGHLTDEELDEFLHYGQKILNENKGKALCKKLFSAKIDGINYV
ncbi:MarR family winged helix-turn-helix transcriptional regulator [Bacillus sp. Marseille-P3661]|uniref:MarR family winged helix-turn-helix transcriptional regulator n=1 Tax=Bacillus sp. Marseille-P3661 TaxID=1936234 RepID=UPI000C85B640|nr:MarR family transcriptional regulator [Bacillus sp. Marseille-P3661]